MNYERFTVRSYMYIQQLIHYQSFSHMELNVNMSVVFLLVVLYRVKRNLQHFQSDVDLVTHIKEWEVEKEAWREEGEGFDQRTDF